MSGGSGVQRLRLTFSQTGVLRYVGHLDLGRTWERALRRAGVPLAYSEGYNPQPKLYFASGLPLGAAGRQEVADVILTQDMAPDAFIASVNPHLPVGLVLTHAEAAPLKTPALQALLRQSQWQVDVMSDEPAASMAQRVEAFLSQAVVIGKRQRKGRSVSYDLRPLVLALSYAGQPEPRWHRLAMILRSEPSATGRPDAVLQALGLDGAGARIERLSLIFAGADSLDETPLPG